MRDYTRKAKIKDSNEWVIGYHVYVDYLDKHYILVSEKTHDGFSGMLAMKQYEVDGNTICEPTGLTDKNGNKIWENDVLKIAKTIDSMGEYYYPPLDYPVNVVVKWNFCAWMWETLCKDKRYISFPDAWCHYEAEVIGNTFDTPDFLQGE